ncbi:HIT family protein [Breoghania sp.]|uniref:HIT family protein n=1 Tax=Breoghania sp. TaxID=2065378 RepID=UPI002AA72596|nr:HIT family protein [Breoghania sp.]
MSDAFSLDPRLEGDSVPLAELALCTVRVMKDARFPWVLMVPRKAGLAEIIDLDAAERAVLIEEIAAVSSALRTVTGCDKLNVGALGNVVRQLHVHVVARFEGDAAWDGPVWGSGAAVAYEPGEREKLAEALLSELRVAGVVSA